MIKLLKRWFGSGSAAGYGDDAWLLYHEYLRRAIAGRELHMADVMLNLAFLEGNQWVRWSKARGLEAVPNKGGNPRRTDNRMGPMFAWRQAALHDESPELAAMGGDEDLADAEAAMVATKLTQYWYRQCGLDDVERLASSWADITGLSFLEPMWQEHPTAKMMVERQVVTDEPEVQELPNGQTVKTFMKSTMVEEPAADLAYQYYTSMQTYWYPMGAVRWSDVRMVMTVDVVDVDYITSWLPEAEGLDRMKPLGNGDMNVQMLESVRKLVNRELVDVDKWTPGDRYLVMTIRERPTREEPNGRYRILGGGLTLYDGELPYLAEAREIDPLDSRNLSMGLIPYQANVGSVGLLGTSPVSGWRPHQVAINKILTDIDVNRQQVGRNFLFVPVSTGLKKGELSNRHGEVNEYTGDKPPTMFQGAPLAGAYNDLGDAEKRLNDVAGRPEVTWGRSGEGVRSFAQQNQQASYANLPLKARARQREKALEDVIRLSLAIGRTRYSRSRIETIYGADHVYLIDSLLDANLRTDIGVVENSTMLKNPDVVDAQLTQMLRDGAFDLPDGRKNTELFWAMHSGRTKNPQLEAMGMIRTKVWRENWMMRKGEVVPVDAWDEHEAELVEHEKFMKRREFMQMPSNLKAAFVVHVITHRDFVMKAMAPEAMEPMPGEIPGAEQVAI